MKATFKDHSHNHHNHENYGSLNFKFIFSIFLNLLITIFEIFGGFLSGSLMLISDSLHNFADTFSLILSFFAIKISNKEKNQRKTFGYKRAEIIVSLFNSSFLLVTSFFLIFESIKRFVKPEEINSNILLFVSIIGFFGNLISVLLLHKESKKSLNIKSSYLHLISDTLSSVAVIIGAIFIKLFKIYFIDSVLTIFISLYILFQTYSILKKSIDILMQSSADLDYNSIKNDVEKIKGVKNIHHVHTWMTNETSYYFEAHIELEDMMLSETCKIMEEIEKLLKEKYKVAHITIQFETNKCENKSMF
ncbi:MAG: Cobalt/zinc/cadmium cation efflux pump protein [candidate division TA06 bacterium 32_111]|uniref:Cobalt/zinc/cadmium cation efflux pump protein n=2 Tax=Bacteria candidate phyla TaxID=1783234 RepID=A0A117M6F1_UNCT6|nr:MAG: Cobalt/zinc/cadmium cation efflux pump protein [candidate division TA06 bacterium 32_111]KUK86902.1 MAG: Cobalt/zinc/cadmium cation efflux pump protein [candidate division TA06 bacterium 34_109]HAF07225.1 cation transporter [candidate division WOR-3 bacterium]HCP16661.1 cation transporter [candidate division WOR-3 bacterium]